MDARWLLLEQIPFAQLSNKLIKGVLYNYKGLRTYTKCKKGMPIRECCFVSFDTKVTFDILSYFW